MGRPNCRNLPKLWIQENYAFFSLLILYAALLPDLYFWSKSCVLISNFYGNSLIASFLTSKPSQNLTDIKCKDVSLKTSLDQLWMVSVVWCQCVMKCTSNTSDNEPVSSAGDVSCRNSITPLILPAITLHTQTLYMLYIFWQNYKYNKF